MCGVGPRIGHTLRELWIWARFEKIMFNVGLRYLIEMTSFRIYKFLKLFILYLKYFAHVKNLHRNVWSYFAWKTFGMPITWLIFHDFDMNIVILVQRNQIKAKVVLKKKVNIELMVLQRNVQRVPPVGYWRKLITFYKWVSL